MFRATASLRVRSCSSNAAAFVYEEGQKTKGYALASAERGFINKCNGARKSMSRGAYTAMLIL